MHSSLTLDREAHNTMSSNPPPQSSSGGPNRNQVPVTSIQGARRPPANANANATPAQPARHQIRGPHSALTDYLATHNIDANRIRRTAEDRRAAAEAALAAERARDEAYAAARGENAETEDEDEDEDEDLKDEEEGESEGRPTRRATRAFAKETPSKASPTGNKQTPKQKAAETARLKALAKVKASKRFQSQRKREGTEDAENSDGAAEHFLDVDNERETQYENCEKCDTRFIVTFYSRSGPKGGLLCSKCSKELDDADRAKSRKKRTEGRINRRAVESERLEGKSARGANDLLTMSLNTLAKHISSADGLGELPTRLMDRLAMLLAKKRLIDPNTLNLFLSPGVKELDVYDAAKLKADDFIRIFQVCPKIERLRVRNAIQFKGPVMKYLVDSPVRLTSISIHGANLLDDEMWLSFLTTKGQYLRELKVYYTDVSFGNDILAAVAEHCPGLTRLKIYHNQQVTDAGLLYIAKLKKLEHLGLHIYQPTTTAPYVEIIKSVGANLRTLSLANIDNLDDSVLAAIHDNCRHLTKLRLKKNEVFTDSGFVNLFTNWENRPLEFVDLSECRHLDSQVPMDNPDNIGLCSNGFTALMKHSAETLRYLNIMSCRHISNDAFIETFNVKGTPAIARYGEEDIPAVAGHVYPKLETLDISFCQGVDDVVVQMIWQSCPGIKELKIFGDFGAKHVRVPKGRILQGSAYLMGLEYEGEEDSE